MRPYLAIIRDSFTEALASRVLWVLLILITLVLLGLAPLGYRAERTTEFRQGDIREARKLVKALRADFANENPSPGRQIWSSIDEETRQELVEFEEEEDEGRISYFASLRKLVEALNKLLEKRDFYDEKAWEGVLLGGEARELVDQDVANLPKEDLLRRNRLLIVKSYPDNFVPQPAKQIVLTYIGFRISPPIRVSETRVKQVIEKYILPSLITILIGFIGVLAAILVTAPIIPQMFDPGALSLLLSKPLSRSLMFLAKFAGGCAFILINVTYLIAGLWCIAGVRFDIWNQGLLLCIPIFLFLFAIYYSISAITGVIWRNAVVCVVMTVVFWLACTVVGGTKGGFERFAIEPREIIQLTNAGETLIALDAGGRTQRWSPDANEWEPTFIEDGGGPMARVLGPIYDSENDMLFAAQAGSRSFFRSGSNLLMGKGSDGWTQLDGPTLPEGTIALLPDPRGRLLAVSNTGVHRLAGELDMNAKKIKVFFMEIPQSLGKPFHPAGPEPALNLNRPIGVAVDRQTANLVIYSRGSLMLLKRQGDDYELAKTVSVEAEEDEEATVVFQGNTILLALADGRLLDYDGSTLALRRTYEPEKHSYPRFMCASPDGRWFAVVFHNGRMHLLDTSQGANTAMKPADVRGQGDVSTVTFSEDDQMLVVDRATRVTQYQLESMEMTKALVPPLSGIEVAYYYAIVPLYTVFPKPAELDNTVQYLVQQEETVDIGRPKHLHLRPWAPVRSSLIFTIVILALACFYIERQDF